MSAYIFLLLLFFLGTVVVIILPVAGSYAYRWKALRTSQKNAATYKKWAIELYMPVPSYVSFRFNLIGFSAFIIIICMIGIYRDHNAFLAIHIILQMIYTWVGFQVGKKVSMDHTKALNAIQ